MRVKPIKIQDFDQEKMRQALDLVKRAEKIVGSEVKRILGERPFYLMALNTDSPEFRSITDKDGCPKKGFSEIWNFILFANKHLGACFNPLIEELQGLAKKKSVKGSQMSVAQYNTYLHELGIK